MGLKAESHNKSQRGQSDRLSAQSIIRGFVVALDSGLSSRAWLDQQYTQRKMRAQRITSDGKRLVKTAIKVRATKDDMALGSDHIQRAEISDELTDFVRYWLTVDERAMITDALMLVVVTAVLAVGNPTVAIHRSIGIIVVPMRPAHTCLGGRCRFGATIHFTRMSMMHTAAQSHMHDEQKRCELWEGKAHEGLQTRKTRPRND